MTETHAMQRALELALRGWGRVHPNPLVGAVILADGVVVGEGYHAEFGGPHAEAVALAAAGERARGATLVTTLEPCTAFAKQPACADLIASAGVRRVVIGMPDPNPAQAGGADRLRAAGIEVETGVLQAEAERQNAVFLRALQFNGRPFVAVKLATSLDNRIADAAGHSRWISGDEARDWVHWFRAGFGAIGVGGRTAQVDDPMLTVRGTVDPRVPPTRVVFLGSRKLSLDSNLVRTAREVPTVVVSDQVASNEAAAMADRGVTVLRGGSLPDVLTTLKQRGIDSIVVEGGGRLTGQLLADRLIDRFAWIVSPVWLGDGGVPATRGYEVGSLLQAERWVVTERRPLGQDTPPRVRPALTVFSGLVTAVGRVIRIKPGVKGGLDLDFAAPYRGLVEGESIAIDGACLTVARKVSGGFRAHLVSTTLARTLFGGFTVGQRVNLERALRVGDRLGGHLVQGHVDGIATVRSARWQGDARLIDLVVPPAVARVSVPLGSITVAGVSLTVNARLPGRGVQISLIPHTLEHTTLGGLRRTDRVHVEGDLIGKYVATLVARGGTAPR